MAELSSATAVNSSRTPVGTSNAPKKWGTNVTARTIDSSLESSNDDLLSVGLIELLDMDDRPVFMLDLTSPTKNVPYILQCESAGNTNVGVENWEGRNIWWPDDKDTPY
jgi:hypothetical protein